MALTIKQLNGDASFLLTFERIDPESPTGTSSTEPFRVLLDPCLATSSCPPSSTTGSSSRPACLTTGDVPEPDVIIISNSRNEHCNEATLRQFSRGGSRPLILAEPAAAKVIQGWRHFDQDRVKTLHRWQDPRQTGRSTVVRIPIEARVIGGHEGLVTVAFITQKRERRGLRSAVGITYRPASSARSVFNRPVSTTVLANKNSNYNHNYSNRGDLDQPQGPDIVTLPPLPAFTPLAPPATSAAKSIRPSRSLASLSPHAKDRGVSVIFAPHGIPYRDIEAYATSHLLAEAALPLTVLLHSFDTVSRPWWLGGTLTSGFEAGQEIVEKLGARAWIGASDAGRDANGLVRRFTRRSEYTLDQVRRLVHGPLEQSETNDGQPGSERHPKAERLTEVLALEVGEDVTLTSGGLWAPDPPPSSDDNAEKKKSRRRRKKPLSIRHVPSDVPGLLAAKATYSLSQPLQPAVMVA